MFSNFYKMSHDYPGEIEMADLIFLRFFEQLFNASLLENTILFVLADHGNRRLNISETLIGRWEERMPFASLYFPPKFRKLYPQAYEVRVPYVICM